MKRIIKNSVTSSNNNPKNAVWVKDGQDMKWKIFKGTNSDTVDPDFLSLANKRNHANYIDVIVVPNGTHPNEVINSSSQNEYEYRKNVYLKRKHEFETLGEDDNNDVLSREEKMRIAKAEMDKVAPESVDSADKYDIYSSSYTPDMLNELINYYSSQDTMSYEDIWDEVVNQYHNESLADDVLDGLDELEAEDDIYSAAEYSDYKSDRRIGVTNQRYKGYMIRLDRAGYGYNVYDKNGELEDAGYPSKEAARNFIDGLVSEADDEIESSVDVDEEAEDPKWICLDIKHVRDSDGMLTDYALYTTEDEDKYICMFGDVDAYPPDEMYADAEFDTEEEALEWFEDYTGPGDEDEDEDYDIYHDVIDAAEELDEDEDDLDHPDQEFDSADTSINSTKLPAIYKMITIPEGSVGIDFGGGKWDNAIEHIRDLGATLCVYDPYNRSKAYNKETLKTLRANGGADWAVTSNVLNVIKEPSARKAVLENISKITKPGAPIYITVYEGRGDSKAGQTKSGYQLNRKTKDYMEEIQEVFPDAKRKGKLIVATNKRSADSSVDIKASSEIVWDDLDWNQQIQLMKKYIRNYKGTKIFEDFADYVNKPVEDIIDSFCDAESYGDIRIPERKQIDSEYRNDDIYSSSSIQARNYGGAYDVDPEQYFTREDLVEFAQDVIDYIANSQDILLDISELSIDGNTITLGLTNEFDNGGFEDTVRFNVDMRKIRKPQDLMKYTMPVAIQFIHAYQTAISEDIDSSSKIESSQSYLDRVEELMEQGLDEETASREAYAEFYPDEYDVDDYDEIYSAESSRKFWYFTRHGVQPGSVPKYVNILDIVDTPEGSYFLADGVISTDDLRNYEIKERKPKSAVVEASKSPNSAANKYPKYMKVSRGGQNFSVHYNLIDNSPSADAHQMWLEFQASVSAIKPYDDAEYAWAQIENGHINVIKGGKVIQRYYYFDADDMDVENSEWCDIIIDEAIDLIAKINKDIEPRMVYNSTSIESENSSNITSSTEIRDIIKKAISGDQDSIKYLKKKGYKVHKLVNPIQISEVGTYEITDTAGNRFNYDNTIIDVTSSRKIRPIDELNDVTDQLRDDLMQNLVDVMSSPNFGFSRNEAIDYSRVDIRFDDDENGIEVEVGAEVDYDGLMQIAQDLDPIIQSYDKAAYFDAEDAGLLIAFIPYKSLRNHMKVNSASDLPEPSLDPHEYDDPEEVDEDVTVEFDMDRVRIDVDKSGSWEYIDDSFLDAVITDDTLYSEEYDVKVRDRNGLLEDLDDILKYDIPVEAGEYRISCHITLVYHITGIEKYDEYPDDNYGDSSEYSTENAEVKFDFHDSYVEDFRIVD